MHEIKNSFGKETKMCCCELLILFSQCTHLLDAYQNDINIIWGTCQSLNKPQVNSYIISRGPESDQI